MRSKGADFQIFAGRVFGYGAPGCVVSKTSHIERMPCYIAPIVRHPLRRLQPPGAPSGELRNFGRCQLRDHELRKGPSIVSRPISSQ